MNLPASIFGLAVQYAFSGYAALFPLLVGALFWKGSTSWGALASTIWAISSVIALAIFQSVFPAPVSSPYIIWSVEGLDVIVRTPGGTTILGFLPVVPMTLISAGLMAGVSLLTKKPSLNTINRYFFNESSMQKTT